MRQWWMPVTVQMRRWWMSFEVIGLTYEVFRDAPRSSEVRPDAPRSSEMRRGLPRYVQMRHSLPRCVQMRHGLPRYVQIRHGLPRCIETTRHQDTTRHITRGGRCFLCCGWGLHVCVFWPWSPCFPCPLPASTQKISACLRSLHAPNTPSKKTAIIRIFLVYMSVCFWHVFCL